MKVSDLIDQLKELPQGATAMLATDAEGNEFSTLDEIDLAYVRKSELGFGRTDSILYAGDLSELDADEGPDDVDDVVVLWPI